jgi:hypothetical protein
MTRISVEVVSEQGPCWPGSAIVALDGKVIAELRGSEGIEITVGEVPISTRALGASEGWANAPWCSCKGVVTEVGKCDGACAVIPGWEDRARFRSGTTSQGDERCS